jgi:hypothetical protein
MEQHLVQYLNLIMLQTWYVSLKEFSNHIFRILGKEKQFIEWSVYAKLPGSV